MTLWVLWNVYNEVGNLSAAMNSVDNAVHGIPVLHLVCDGKYPSYPDLAPHSTDGTHRIIKQRAYALTNLAADEPVKRTTLFQMADLHAVEGDWCLVLDADERLGKFELPIEGNLGFIQFVRHSDGYPYVQCRLVKWEKGLHYKKRHYFVYNSEDKQVFSVTSRGDATVFASHSDDARTVERQAKKQQYYRWLEKHEA